MTAASVIYIEDDDQLRLAVGQSLDLAGFALAAFADAASALATIDRDFAGVVVSDIRMPRMDGFQLLAAVRAIDADIPVILVTGHGDVPMAVAALRDGAFDFLTKPFSTDHLTVAIGRALDRRALVIDHRQLQATLAAYDDDSPLIGASPAMARLRETIAALAATDLDVLVEGETGTGKELVARLLHRQSRRRGRPFVAVDCGAIPQALAEIELFGHAADSVGHTRLARTGRIAAANGGTLLLDTIDAMPPAIQAKLLRVIEEREVLPIGADRPQLVDVRIVATTSGDLAARVRAGAFRADLFYRLSAVRIVAPPVRDRAEDRMLLFASFVAEAERELARPGFVLTDAVRRRLADHDWPGNVRELRNAAFAAVLGVDRDGPPTPDAALDLPTRLAKFEAGVLVDVLTRTRGNVGAALLALGIPRKTFYDKLARHGISARAFRKGSP